MPEPDKPFYHMPCEGLKWKNPYFMADGFRPASNNVVFAKIFEVGGKINMVCSFLDLHTESRCSAGGYPPNGVLPPCLLKMKIDSSQGEPTVVGLWDTLRKMREHLEYVMEHQDGNPSPKIRELKGEISRIEDLLLGQDIRKARDIAGILRKTEEGRCGKC